MARYKWKGRDASSDEMRGFKAAFVGREIKRLAKKHGSGITAKEVVEESRPKNSPLHKWFTWDDTAAAEHWRRNEATMMLRFCLEIRETDGGQEIEIPIVVCGPSEENGNLSNYPIDIGMADATTSSYVVQRALDGLIAWKTKYGMLKGFEKVVRAIDSLDAVDLVEQKATPEHRQEQLAEA